MKTTLNKDQFAKWFMNHASQTIEMYLFDTFYDMNTIMEVNKTCIDKARIENKNTFPTNEPIYNTLFWFNRKTGSDILRNDQEDIYKTMLENNANCYQLKFCLNADYFTDQEYCTVIKIK
jgi:hypothetical protein